MGSNDPDTATVFVIDDDVAVRDSLTTLLLAYGLAVEAFDSVASFKNAYRPARPACLILDQHLPVTTGLEFLASAEGRQLCMPVILATAQSDKDIRAQAAEAGVYAFLAKPVDTGALLAAIEGAIVRSKETPCPQFGGDGR